MSALTAELALIDISRAQRLRLDARRMIDAVSDLYDNPDALAERYAMQAYEAERPAFWSTVGYHSQRLSAFHLAAHRTSIREALKSTLRAACDDFIRALDTLVPLNDAAADALSAAYSEYGSWLERSELLARRVRRMPKTRVTL